MSKQLILDGLTVIKLLGSKTKSLIGIDLSTYAIKAIELLQSNDGYEVKAYGKIRLPENAMEGNNVKDMDAVIGALRKLIASQNFHARKCVIAIPTSTTISKVISVNEGLSEDEIEELVAIEADKIIPYPIDEINLDFEVLGVSAKNTSEVDVLLVASKTENVNSRVSVVSESGLIVSAVEVEAYAVERAITAMKEQFPDKGLGKLIALVDIGALATRFYVFHNLDLIFSHEEDFGGNQLVEAIMTRYEMDREDALIALEKNSLNTDFQEDVVVPFQESVIQQVKRGLQFFFSSGQYSSVDLVLLGGGVSTTANFADKLSKSITIDTKIVNPFLNMNIDKKVNKKMLEYDAPNLMVACGLAMRDDK